MDAKKGKTRKESTPIKVWVTPEEEAAIATKADAHSLSASSYLRRLGLAMPLQSTIDQQAILDLVKINADLGRFGGLIKMWLTTNADFECERNATERALPESRFARFLRTPLAKTSLSPAAQLGDWRSEFDVEDRVRHCDGLIGRGAIPFVERDFVCYRVTE
jgi:hypothetical protein